MMGFLSNLISRSSGRLPAIQPRLASLYEPPRGAIRQPAMSRWPHRDDSWNASADEAEGYSGNPTADIRRGDESPVLNPAWPTQESIAVSISRDIAVPAIPNHPSATQEPRQTTAREFAGSANEHEPDGATMVPLPVRLTPPGALQPASSVSGGLQRLEKPGQERTDSHPAGVPRETSALENPASRFIAQSSGRPGEDPVARDPGIAFHAPATLRQPDAAATRGPLAREADPWNVRAKDTHLKFRSAQNVLEIAKQNPAPEPVVHVSIDRIEVRAATPAASSVRSERPTQPGMSLKEYLRRRSSGRKAQEAAS